MDPKTAPRFEIKKWNAVAMWSWDICADTVRRRYSRWDGQSVTLRETGNSLTHTVELFLCGMSG
jgi:hypothetical protein